MTSYCVTKSQRITGKYFSVRMQVALTIAHFFEIHIENNEDYYHSNKTSATTPLAITMSDYNDKDDRSTIKLTIMITIAITELTILIAISVTDDFICHDANVTPLHYEDVIMTTTASQITSLTVVYSTVYSDADQRKHQRSASLAFVWGIHRDRWIPRTKGQLHGKCFHLMTSSWQKSWRRRVYDTLFLFQYPIRRLFVRF